VHRSHCLQSPSPIGFTTFTTPTDFDLSCEPAIGPTLTSSRVCITSATRSECNALTLTHDWSFDHGLPVPGASPN
jgi:hypothetical protein